MAGRKATNLSLSAEVLDDAKAMKINISRAAEKGIAEEIRKERERIWKLENAEAFRSSNEYVEKHGLPLAKFRQF
jgi:antitoxin CcdA